ncbi:PTS sugar transporter subunit IIB [Microbacterium sp. NPDC090007]|uniref:PTS sugar transporter subunit IIB n=1 Tax=Microbacterium sp. NPDC090007 TaxID=3364204 RepID=UPI0038245991
MKILVVCGAGASSTFVAQRVRHAALEKGLDLSASAGAWHALPHDLDAGDVVLVGPHLALDVERIRAEASPRGVLVALLPDDVFTDRSGARTLALIEDALRSRQPADTI